MSATSSASDVTGVTGASIAPVTRLSVLLFTDIVGSTDLKSKLGTAEYAKLLSVHNALFEDAMRGVAGGLIIKHTGDGYFATLPTASDAVRFALQFQSRMKRQDWGFTPLATRVGIHIGEVQLLDMAGRADVVGFSADIAARLMSLALGGQILLTEGAFNDARQFVGRMPDSIDDNRPLRWIAHGAYLFKGSDDPLDVFEVGIEGLSPLARPDHSDKVKRVVPHDQEATLGWRPAIGLEVPSRPGWTLQRKIGEGGFGEVWLAQHHRTRDSHIFKFCFDVERLRSFKRELTLFRLIREALGDRPDIARLYEVKLDEPPFFLEGEYSAGGNLMEWSERFGGIAKLALGERLELVAKIADAVAAAHSVGILHKDIKPSNVLIHEEHRDAPNDPSARQRVPVAPVQPRLCDFGIGILADRTQLQARAITATGFTQLTQNESSRTGTRIYAPPESLLNRPFTTQGDVFALGVMTYQMAVGDLTRPLAPGWERDVADEILREDIAAMVEGDPARRLASASEVARRLRTLPARREQRQSERLTAERAKRRRRQVQWMATATVALGLLSAAFAVALVRERHLRAQIATQKDRAEQQEAEAKRQTAIATAVSRFQSAMLASADPEKLLGDKVTVVDAAHAAVGDLDAGSLADQPLVEAGVRATIGLTFLALGRYDDARPNLQRALDLRRASLPSNSPDIAESLSNLADLMAAEGNLKNAEAMNREALAIVRQALPPGRPEIAATANNLAVVLQQAGKFSEAEPVLRDALAASRAALPAGHRDIATNLDNLAQFMQSQGKLDDAKQLFEEALQINRKALPDGHRAIALSLNNLANLLAAQGKMEEALPLCRESLAICRRTLPPGHRETAEVMTNLAGALQSLGQREEAQSLFREALASLRKSLRADHPRIAVVLNNFAMFLFDDGKADEAESLLREAVAIARQSLGPNHPDLAATINNLVRVLQSKGETAQAEDLLREALRINRAAFPAAHPAIARSLVALGALMQNQERLPDAEALFAEALAIDRQSLPAGHADIASAASGLGRVLFAAGQLEKAETLLREAVAIRREKFGANAASTRLTARGLAELLDRTNRSTEADTLRRECGLVAPTSQPE